MKRREALVHLGVGAAGLLLSPRGLIARPEVQPDRLADLAERIRTAPHEKIFEVAADAIVAGADAQTLLGATFLAGVHDVQPRPVGGRLHSVMTVESSYRLVEVADSPKQAWLIVLWTVDSFKATQRESGDQWVLPPPPKVQFSSESQARRELIAAMDSWDEQRADRAIVGLLPYHDRESLYEILWPYVGRCMAYLGHKVVYGAMTESVLRRIDWDHAEPTARSLVYGLVGQGRGSPLTRSFESAEALAGSIPDDWLGGKGDDPDQTLSLVERLLKGDYREAQQAVIESFREGLGPQGVWDAIRLAAAELFLRRKSDDPESGEAIRAVHAVTELWSLGYAWRTTKIDRTKRLLILQSAGWVAELRDALLDRDAISMEGSGIASLGAGEEVVPPNLDELFERNEPAAGRGYFDRHPDSAAKYIERMRIEVASKALEYHQLKYAVAIEDESRNSSPRWASRLLAPALGYMPTEADRQTDLTERALAALRKAQVL